MSGRKRSRAAVVDAGSVLVGERLPNELNPSLEYVLCRRRGRLRRTSLGEGTTYGRRSSEGDLNADSVEGSIDPKLSKTVWYRDGRGPVGRGTFPNAGLEH